MWAEYSFCNWLYEFERMQVSQGHLEILIMSVKHIPEHYRYLGRLGKTYQLKGGLRLYSDLDDEVLFKLERIFIENIGESDVRDIKHVAPGLNHLSNPCS